MQVTKQLTIILILGSLANLSLATETLVGALPPEVQQAKRLAITQATPNPFELISAAELCHDHLCHPQVRSIDKCTVHRQLYRRLHELGVNSLELLIKVRGRYSKQNWNKLMRHCADLHDTAQELLITRSYLTGYQPAYNQLEELVLVKIGRPIFSTHKYSKDAWFASEIDIVNRFDQLLCAYLINGVATSATIGDQAFSSEYLQAVAELVADKPTPVAPVEVVKIKNCWKPSTWFNPFSQPAETEAAPVVQPKAEPVVTPAAPVAIVKPIELVQPAQPVEKYIIEVPQRSDAERVADYQQADQMFNFINSQS